jgi:hypothetical protein
VEVGPLDAKSIAIVFGDDGRKSLEKMVNSRLASGQRVLAVDPIGFGEAFKGVEAMELQMIATVGERPLGIQVAQLQAIAAWLGKENPSASVTLVASGPRASVAALIATAIGPEFVDGVAMHDSWPSLKEFIRQDLECKDAPEIACFGLLEDFDIPQLEALIAPRAVKRINEN